MLFHAHLPKPFGGYAVRHATTLKNMSPTAALEDNVTPFQLWNRRKPDVSRLHVFGCPAYALVPKPRRRKLDSRSSRCIYVGDADEHRAYLIFDPETEEHFIDVMSSLTRFSHRVTSWMATATKE